MRKGKKLETAFRNLLNERSVGEESTWEDVRGNLEGDAAFEAIAQEYERVRIFKEFIKVRYTSICGEQIQASPLTVTVLGRRKSVTVSGMSL